MCLLWGFGFELPTRIGLVLDCAAADVASGAGLPGLPPTETIRLILVSRLKI